MDNWLYTYDAWNRLVRASFAPDGDTANAVVRAEYTYNGLHQRASRRAAANLQYSLDAPPRPGADDEPGWNSLGNLYYYDSAWRLCEERSATHWDGAAEFTPARITQRFWCPLYIDALIATQTDTSGADPGPGADGDFTDAIFENTLYAACDRKYDVIAMTDPAGNLKERTDYSPYGVARQRPPADLNGDGKIDGVDQLIFFNAWGAAIGAAAYNPDADINSDGAVNGSDFLILSNAFGATPAPAGAISQHGNTVGYSGYIYDEAINMSLARFRWFDAETGRWATRDPLGNITSIGAGIEYMPIYSDRFIRTTLNLMSFATSSLPTDINISGHYPDGSNLYQYARSNSINLIDPLGLMCAASAPTSRTWGDCMGDCMWDHMTNDVGMALFSATVAACGPSFPIPKRLLPRPIWRPSPGTSPFTNPLSITDRLFEEAFRRGFIPKNPSRGTLRSIGRWLAKRACPAALAAYTSYLAGGSASCAVLCADDPYSF